MIVKILLIVAAIFMGGFFSGSEIAFISFNSLKLRYLLEKGDYRARLLWNFLKNPNWIISTTLLGTNLAVVSSSSLLTSLIFRINPANASLLTTLIISPFILLFGELIPKALARRAPNRTMMAFVMPLRLFQIFLYPLVILTVIIVKGLLRLMKAERKLPLLSLTREEIKILTGEITQQGILAPQERDMIQAIFRYGITRVKEIMTRMDEAVILHFDYSTSKVKEIAQKSGFTRFPVFKKGRIQGVFNIYDLLYKGGDWHKWIRPVREVNINKSLVELATEMKDRKENMVMVTTGKSIVGLLTLEDLVEEIAGRICPSNL